MLSYYQYTKENKKHTWSCRSLLAIWDPLRIRNSYEMQDDRTQGTSGQGNQNE